MHQCGFINFNIGATLVWDIDYRRGYVCGEAKNIWEISIHSTHFCCDSKTALEKKES